MLIKKIIIAAFLLLLISPLNSSALERFEIITTTEMTQLLDERENGKIDFLLVNALDEMIYRQSSIPGSINIPLGKFQEYSQRLGKNTDQLIITY